MKLFWKQMFGILTIFLLTFPLFGTILLQTSFRTALEREKGNGLEELKMFPYSFLSSLEELSDHYTMDEEMLRTLSESVGKNLLDSRHSFCIYHENGVSIRDEVALLMQDFNHMADELQENITELKEAARRQEEFTGAFAHELKTPLTSMIGYGEMLMMRELTQEDRRAAASYIYRESRRLEKLAYKMMELIGLGKGDISFQPIQTKELAAKLENMTEAMLREKEIRFHCQMEEGMLIGDFDLLLSLLGNLVDNARKACGVSGHISVCGKKQEGGHYRITVSDNGCGIPEEELGKNWRHAIFTSYISCRWRVVQLFCRISVSGPWLPIRKMG